MSVTSGLDRIDMEHIDFGMEDFTDLHGVLAELRTKGEFATVNHMGSPAILVLSQELVGSVFKDEENIPAHAFYDVFIRPVQGKTIQCMTGEEHKTNRSLVTPAFRRGLMESYRADVIEPLAHQLIDEFASDGSAELVEQFSTRLPFLVITRLLGLSAEGDPDLRRWAFDLFNFQRDPEAGMRASTAITEMLAPLLEQRREQPTDDLLSRLAHEEVDGERLDDEEIFSFVRLLYPAGVDTTYLSLGNMLYALLTHPDQLERLREDPTEIRWAVEESLRWEPGPSMVPRRAPKDLSSNGIDVPEGTMIHLSISAANRDPDVYPDPHTFDITRRMPGRVTFGSGPHSCVGMQLARLQMTVALEVIVERLPGLRLADPDNNSRVVGTIGNGLRGPNQLPVEFDR